MKRRLLRSLLILTLVPVGTVFAATTEIGPADNIETAVAALAPGDELVLRGGTYTFTENITLTATGSASQEIVIRAKEGESPVLTQPTDQRNVVEVRDSQYLVLRNLTFTGGSHGVRLINSDFITIEGCEIYETGDVALSANSGGTYEGLKILRNHIHHTNGTGEGMYLGCNNDACRIANSLIEGNYVHHTNRASVSQGDGIEIKDGSYGNVVRDNVIHDTNYPGILVYSTAGNGAPNLVERNVIWNVNDNTVQMAADVVFRNNIVLGNVSMRSHQSGSPSNIEFVHNTVINSGNGVEVRNVIGSVLIANNAIYAQGPAINLISGDLSQVELSGNVGAGGLSGASAGYSDGNGIATDMQNGNYSGAPPIDPYPASGSALVGGGNTDHLVSDDFNGTPRGSSADAGAYAYGGSSNPGWVITEAFKSVDAPRRPRPPENFQAE